MVDTRTMNNTFAELGLNEHILAGVEALGFTTPTPVQSQAIPAVLEGRDIVASAQTGTGKTAAFALPVLQIIAPASRAAREAIVSATTIEEQADAPDVTAFAATHDDSPSISVPASLGDRAGDAAIDAASRDLSNDKDDFATNPSGEAPKPKRRPRRHHRKKPPSADPTTSTGETTQGMIEAASATHEAVTPHGDDTPAPDTGSDGTPSKKAAPARKRKRRRTRMKEDAQKDARQGDAQEPTKPKPKRKRKRKRRQKSAASPDSRASNPNAHPFGPFALIVTPTRELAQQIDHVVSVVCEHTGQRAVIVMGGAKFERQIRELEAGCDMLVATPGRLIDLIEHDHVNLSQVQVLVLDEADRMLDMGFWPSVRHIVSSLPPERQNLLFSATIPPSIQSTIDAMLHDPVRIEIARVGETADTVEEHLCPVTQGQKTQLLQELIRTGGAEQGASIERVLVFCRTKQRVDDVCRTLKQTGFSVELMHSDRPQKLRERALERFRTGTCQILVATDVMSRGIDVSGIDAVVNFDVPLDPEDYVHRVGRTGRAGATGHAYTFVAPDEISPLREIEYFTGKLVPTWDLPDFAYDDGRIVPGTMRSTVKPKRTMFSGMKARGRGMAGGRYGRHY